MTVEHCFVNEVGGLRMRQRVASIGVLPGDPLGRSRRDARPHAPARRRPWCSIRLICRLPSRQRQWWVARHADHTLVSDRAEGHVRADSGATLGSLGVYCGHSLDVPQQLGGHFRRVEPSATDGPAHA